MKVLVFDIWADYGHFRKFYTTTSPLTFSFPAPSTIAGILGAIYGAGKYFDGSGALAHPLRLRSRRLNARARRL